MKRLLLPLVSSLLLALTANAQTTTELFPIYENGLWGYINAAGDVAIAPQFHAAKTFDEGCAVVRKGGTYGYIDPAGRFAIEPVYDYAEPFIGGTARVYLDGKPLIIDRSGRVLFEHDFAVIAPFEGRNVARVKTASGRWGLIDRMGRIVADTIFHEIKPFHDGLAVVQEFTKGERASDRRIGVIDTGGRWIVPLGMYEGIDDFNEGYAFVTLSESDSDRRNQKGIIDAKGRFLTRLDKRIDPGYSNPGFHDGRAVVDVYVVDRDTIQSWSSENSYSYKGAIDSTGKVVCGESDWTEFTPFEHGKAFIRMGPRDWRNEKWFLIDRSGRKLNDRPITRILYDLYSSRSRPLFQKGIAFVETADGWVAIDTSGRFLTAPRTFNSGGVSFRTRDVVQVGSMLFFMIDMSDESEERPLRVGFWNPLSDVVVPPRYDGIEFADAGALLHVYDDGLMGYIDRTGRKVWSEKRAESEGVAELDLDVMNRGYFYAAAARNRNDLNGFGGWGGSNNVARVRGDVHAGKGNAPVLEFRSDDTATWGGRYKGIKLYLINRSNGMLYFSASDSRLPMKLQAKDRKGEWRDIEYLPSSWCGNSHHTLHLAKGEYWEFTAPLYHGVFPTKIRAQLLYKRSVDQEEADVVYSNEIDGSVNPGQFWRKGDYVPGGLMDPYNE